MGCGHFLETRVSWQEAWTPPPADRSKGVSPDKENLGLLPYFIFSLGKDGAPGGGARHCALGFRESLQSCPRWQNFPSTDKLSTGRHRHPSRPCRLLDLDSKANRSKGMGQLARSCCGKGNAVPWPMGVQLSSPLGQVHRRLSAIETSSRLLRKGTCCQAKEERGICLDEFGGGHQIA